MIEATNGEVGPPIQRRSRQRVLASEAGVTKFTIEIQHDTIAFLERIIKTLLDLLSPFLEALLETFQSLNSLALEDNKTLLEFSTGILMFNWIVCNALVPTMETFLEPISETNSWFLSPPRLFLEAMNILNTTLGDFDDSIAKNYYGASVPRDGTNGGDANPLSSLNYFTLDENGILNFISPTAVMIICPITIMIMTCVIADNNYYLFATLFAPAVDRMLSGAKSLFALITPNNQEHQNRIIPDDRETHDGVLWGMVALFCLESLLVGSIVVLMVLISLTLTILASVPTLLSPKSNPELLEDVSKILFGFLFSWVACVVTTNVLRMVLYQTVDDDD
mmetsp:Transcript_20190/g.50237  ORF Transcript_20190/g.50237 Transcript_20190/m.50237 type:complete len:336 (+) Transcript_20190:131-1138(+)